MILKYLKEGSVRKRDGPTKEEESWRIITNNEIQDTLQTANIVQFIQLLRLRWYGRTERLNNKRMPEWKEQGKGGAQKRWTDEVQENLKEMGIRLAQNGQRPEKVCTGSQGPQQTVPTDVP